VDATAEKLKTIEETTLRDGVQNVAIREIE